MTGEGLSQIQRALTMAHHDYQGKLVAHALFKVNDRALSQDLVQDTFIKTWVYLVKGGEVVMMRAFLYHILNNLIIDEYRKHKTTSLDVLLEKGFEPNAENPQRIPDILDGKSAIQLINLLPKTYQKVLHMRYVQDLTLKEISLITKQSKNTVAVQAHRGLAKLRILHTSPTTKKE